MKIKPRIFLFLLIFALLCGVLISCSTPGKELVGRWEIDIQDEELGNFSMVYHFKEDGEIYLEQKTEDVVPFSIFFGIWSVEGEKLVIQGDGKKDTFSYSVTDTELTLSREGEETLNFRKV